MPRLVASRVVLVVRLVIPPAAPPEKHAVVNPLKYAKKNSSHDYLQHKQNDDRKHNKIVAADVGTVLPPQRLSC